MNILRPKPVLVYPLTDKQIVFDYVYHHFIVEKNPFGYIAETDNCIYDTPSGGCAVGCLLPEELRKRIGDAGFSISLLHNYKKENLQLNNPTYKAFLAFADDLTQVFGEDIRYFISALQQYHDSCSGAINNFEKFDNILKGLARDQSLTLPISTE
jgi:hypothetical protein